MKCAVCHHEMVREKVLSPEISEILFEKIKNKEFVEQMINVPVLDGTYG